MEDSRGDKTITTAKGTCKVKWDKTSIIGNLSLIMTEIYKSMTEL